jgi:Ca2+-binding RTX toxin-like protein
MATYNLNAADLITLLASTVQPTTGGSILEALINNGEFPGPVGATYGVETDIGPSGGSVLPDQNITIPATINGFPTQLELITLPTSTAVTGSTFPTPGVGPVTPVTNFTFTSPGGIVIGVGDQAVDVVDKGPGGDTLVGGAGFERFGVRSGDNLLISGTGQNSLFGGSGDDTLIGGGQSRVQAGTGNQKLVGGTIAGAHDTLIGGSGDDTLTVTEGDNRLIGGTGFNTLMGGSGDDTLIGGGLSSLVAGTGQQKLEGGQTTTAQDTLTGGSGKDVLVAFEGANSLTAGSGQNTLRGFGGDNTLNGAGATRIVAAGGDETLTAAAGDDTMVLNSPTVKVDAFFGSGALKFLDTLTSGTDTQAGASATITGGLGTSRVFLGDTGDDSVTSGLGAMRILSSQSADDLISNSSTAAGGTHTLQFKNGQTIVVNDVNSNITIHFTGAGGGGTPV